MAHLFQLSASELEEHLLKIHMTEIKWKEI